MSIISAIYPGCIQSAFNGEIQWASPRIKVMLLRDTYLFNATHTHVADVITDEIVATGYQSGGLALTGLTSEINSTGVIFHNSTLVTWGNSTITARYSLLYDSFSDKLIALTDFGKNMSSVSADFVLNWGTNGIFQISAA